MKFNRCFYPGSWEITLNFQKLAAWNRSNDHYNFSTAFCSFFQICLAADDTELIHFWPGIPLELNILGFISQYWTQISLEDLCLWCEDLPRHAVVRLSDERAAYLRTQHGNGRINDPYPLITDHCYSRSSCWCLAIDTERNKNRLSHLTLYRLQIIIQTLVA